MEWRHRFFWLAVTLPWVPYVLTLVAKDDPLLGWAGAQRTLEAGLSSLWQALSSPSNGIDPRNYWRALAGWWASADALVAAVLAALAMSTAVFLLSLPTNNHSWVRRGSLVITVNTTVKIIRAGTLTATLVPPCRWTSCGAWCQSATLGTSRCTAGWQLPTCWPPPTRARSS